jgi:hypothetical protein
MRIVAIALALASILFQARAAELPAGSVCVASRADDPFRGQVVPPTGEVSSNGLRVRIDKSPSEPWPQRKSLKIDGLDVGERHLLAVLDSRGKPVESLWFKFSDYKSTELCMAYDAYQGVELQEDNRHTPWCKCKEQGIQH